MEWEELKQKVQCMLGIQDKEDFMTIQKIKEQLNNHIGATVKIKQNLGRNKYETYEAKIKQLYNNVFVIENDNHIKSFSYTDVITKIIKIEF